MSDTNLFIDQKYLAAVKLYEMYKQTDRIEDILGNAIILSYLKSLGQQPLPTCSPIFVIIGETPISDKELQRLEWFPADTLLCQSTILCE